MTCAPMTDRVTMPHRAPSRRSHGGPSALAVIETIDKPSRGGPHSETFEAHRTAERRRLSADHQTLIRYVFCDWAAEVGARSNCETVINQMIEAGRGSEIVAAQNASAERRRCDRCQLARRSARTQCPRCGYAPQEIYCHPPGAGVVRVGTGLLFAQERWSDDRELRRRGEGGRDRRENVLHAWRALVSLEGNRVASLVILHALYGDRPPGMMLPEGTWPKAVDAEYRRVVRYTEIAGGSDTSIEKRLLIDKRKRKASESYEVPGWSLPLSKQDGRVRKLPAGQDETEAAWKARIAAAELVRKGLVVQLGRQCEWLIADASVIFEAAWEATS